MLSCTLLQRVSVVSTPSPISFLPYLSGSASRRWPVGACILAWLSDDNTAAATATAAANRLRLALGLFSFLFFGDVGLDLLSSRLLVVGFSVRCYQLRCDLQVRFRGLVQPISQIKSFRLFFQKPPPSQPHKTYLHFINEKLKSLLCF